MRIVNINVVEDVMFIKDKIETELLSENKITEPMDINSFVNFLDLKNNIFIKEDTVLPFKIYDDILISVGKPEELEYLESVLNDIEYNLANLSEVDINNVYLGELDKNDFYFIINSKYHIIKK
jgi:hypothetical protein